MELLLFVTTLSLLAFSLWIRRFDIRCPDVLYNAAWTLASFFYLLCHASWESFLSVHTYFLICIGNLAFNVPFWLLDGRGKFCICRKNTSSVHSKLTFPELSLSTTTYVLLLGYVVLSIFYCAYRVFSIAYAVGEPESFSEVMEYARYATTHLAYSYGRIMTNLIRLNGVVSLVVSGILLQNFKGLSLVKKVLSVVIIALAAASLLLGTGRTYLFRLFLGILLLVLFKLYGDKEPLEKKKILRIFGIACAGICAFFVVFALVGVFVLGRGNDQGLATLTEQITKYIGSPIMGLNYFLENREEYGFSYFGANTFMSVYMFLARTVHLINLEPAPSILPFMQNAPVTTNAYTVFYQYYYDFGFIGSVIMLLIVGFIFAYLFKLCKKHKNLLLRLVYADLAYCVVFSFFAETFFSGINTNLVRLAMVVIVYFGLHFCEKLLASLGKKKQ